MEWISVKTRKPCEELKKYREKYNGSIYVPIIVICDCWSFPDLGYYDGHKFWDASKYWCIDSIITHWMPLPEPPKE